MTAINCSDITLVCYTDEMPFDRAIKIAKKLRYLVNIRLKRYFPFIHPIKYYALCYHPNDKYLTLLESIVSTINSVPNTKYSIPYIYNHNNLGVLCKTTFNRIIKGLSKLLKQILDKNITCDSIHIEYGNKIRVAQQDINKYLHEFIWYLNRNTVHHFVTVPVSISEQKEEFDFDTMIDIMLMNTMEYYERKLRLKITE